MFCGRYGIVLGEKRCLGERKDWEGFGKNVFSKVRVVTGSEKMFCRWYGLVLVQNRCFSNGTARDDFRKVVFGIRRISIA